MARSRATGLSCSCTSADVTAGADGDADADQGPTTCQVSVAQTPMRTATEKRARVPVIRLLFCRPPLGNRSLLKPEPRRDVPPSQGARSASRSVSISRFVYSSLRGGLSMRIGPSDLARLIPQEAITI